MVPKKLGVQQRQRARRRHGLRADRHDHRAEPRRLLPRQQHEVQAGGVRELDEAITRPTRPAAATSTRPTSPASTRRASSCAEPRRPRDPAGDHLEGAARAVGAPRRRRVVRRSCAGRSSPCSRPRSRRHAGQRRPAEGRAQEPGRPALPRRHGRASARGSASTTTGPTGSSSRSATTARCFERNVGQGSPLKHRARPQQAVEQGRPACTRRRSAEPDGASAGRGRRSAPTIGGSANRLAARRDRWPPATRRAPAAARAGLLHDPRVRAGRLPGRSLSVVVVGVIAYLVSQHARSTSPRQHRVGLRLPAARRRLRHLADR